MQMLSIIIMMPQYTGHGTRVTRVLIEYGADKSAISRASGLRVSRRNNNSEPQLHPRDKVREAMDKGRCAQVGTLAAAGICRHGDPARQSGDDKKQRWKARRTTSEGIESVGGS